MENSKLGKTTKLILGIVFLVLSIAGIVLLYVFKDALVSNNLKAVMYIADAACAIALMVGIGFVYLACKKEEEHKMNTKQMSMIAIQSAITVILYYFVKFNLPFFPPWLDIQVSEIPALITAFMYGPYAGCIVILIRFILKLPGTITAGVGELADLILGITLVIIAGTVYRKHRTLKGALIGTSIGVGTATVLACVLNWLVLIPAYINIAHFPFEALVGMLGYIPGVTESNFMVMYIFVGVLPFNIFRYILVVLVTFVLYKHIHKLINRITDAN